MNRNYKIKTINVKDNEKNLYRLLDEHQFRKTKRDNFNKDFSYYVEIDGKNVGGITARLWHTEVHISLLALENEFRGIGLAFELMQKVEQDARNNNATIITITTQDFQAPDFYQKCGYEIFATLPDCPFEGTTRYYFMKRI